MARIGIDLRMVEGRLHGIARYALELARRIPALAPQHEFFALVPPEGLPNDLGTLMPSIRLVPTGARFLSVQEQPLLAAVLLRERAGLFHATSFSLPLLWPGTLVATLHDANHLALPEEYGRAQQVYYRVVVGPRSRFASALLTVSEFSRADLARRLSIPAERFQVIPNGVDRGFAPATAAGLNAFRRRHHLPARYFLAVGNEKPFKNLKLLAGLTLPQPIALLAGEGAAASQGFDPARTVSLPAMSEAELSLLYAGATALLLPSRYEGFGLPALEAMAVGCPVVYSRGSAMDELCGEAGVLLGPEDALGWEQAARRLAEDAAHRRGLVDLGRERAARYTWERTARETWHVYQRALAKAGR